MKLLKLFVLLLVSAILLVFLAVLVEKRGGIDSVKQLLGRVLNSSQKPTINTSIPEIKDSDITWPGNITIIDPTKPHSESVSAQTKPIEANKMTILGAGVEANKPKSTQTEGEPEVDFSQVYDNLLRANQNYEQSLSEK